MPARKVDEIKRCKCGKLLRSWNKSGLCEGCLRKYFNRIKKGGKKKKEGKTKNPSGV
jgi:hypothetical protein